MIRSLLMLMLMLLPNMALAQEAAEDPAAGQPGLAGIDWLIVALYAVATLALGWYFGRQQKSTQEYFIGSGRMNSAFIGISLFATLLSTISYLAMPGEAIGKGPAWMASLFSYPFTFLIVGFVLLPIYMRQRVTSAYELLEERLGRGTRLLGASMFIVLRLVWMSLLIFLTAGALATIMGLDEKWEPVIVLVAGLVAVTYTSIGGLRAVVVTDFMQTILLYGGALLVIATVTYRVGGLSWFPTKWHSNWDAQPVFSLDPATRVTIFGAAMSALTWHVCTMGGDQVSVQRFMATTDARAARKSLATNLIVGVIVISTLTLAGFALLGFYEAFPHELGDHAIKADADKLFPHFISVGLPPVVSGLVVSAMFAAAMSSIDSGINSITAVLMTDFWSTGEPSRIAEKDPVQTVVRFRRARLLAFGIGAVVVLGSSLMKYVPGNITAVTGKTSNLLTAPIFGLFFFALFVRFAKPTGVWLGCVAGVATAVSIAFSGPIFGFNAHTGTDPISFQLISPVTLLVNIIVGCVASLILPAHESPAGRVVRYVPALVAIGLIAALATIWRPVNHIRLDEATRARCERILRAGMHSDQFWPAIHAAEGLTIGGHADEVRAYLQPKLDGDYDDQQRCGIARELVRAGASDYAKVMLEILANDDDFGHTHAAESLYKVGRIGDGVALGRAMNEGETPQLRLMAAAALAKAGDPAALAYVRENIDSPDPDTLRVAAWILGRIGSASDIERIRDRLEDASAPLLRAYLEHALAALRDDSGLAALSANLEHEDAAIRTYAATFSGDAREVSVAPKLIRMLDDPHLDARLRAAQSLLDLANRK